MSEAMTRKPKETLYPGELTEGDFDILERRARLPRTTLPPVSPNASTCRL